MRIDEHKSMYGWLTRPADPGEIERKNKIQNQVAGLSDELTPGPLRAELQGSFDPSQETYEEYLRRIHLGPRPFNMNQGGRIGFGNGGKVITPSGFKKLWNTFEGRNKEFADLLNKKGFVTATGKAFSDRNVSEYVGYYKLEKKPRGGKIFPKTQKKLDKLDKLIVEANNTYTKAPTIGELIKKSGFVKSGKLSDISRDGPAQSLVREKLKKLLTTNQKMEAYINNVMLSETALVKDFYAPSEHLRKKFNISSATYAKFTKKSKAIANTQELFLNLGRPNSFNKYGFNPNGSSKTIAEFDQIIKNRIPFSSGFGALREDNATSFILQSAKRHYQQSVAAGKTPQVTFITNLETHPDPKDWQFIDNKSGKLFSVDPSIENVEFRGKTYKNNYLNHVDASKLYSKEFGNVYKMYDVDLPKYLNATVIGPNGTRVTLDSLLRKRNYERTGSKNFLIRRAAEVDHLDLLNDPFGRRAGNIRLLDRITNIQAGGIRARYIREPKALKKRLNDINYLYKDKNTDEFIKRLAKNYDNQPQIIFSRRTGELIEKRKAADPYFKKSATAPIKVSDTLEIPKEVKPPKIPMGKKLSKVAIRLVEDYDKGSPEAKAKIQKALGCKGFSSGGRVSFGAGTPVNLDDCVKSKLKNQTENSIKVITQEAPGTRGPIGKILQGAGLALGKAGSVISQIPGAKIAGKGLGRSFSALASPLGALGYIGWDIKDELEQGKSKTDIALDPEKGLAMLFPETAKQIAQRFGGKTAAQTTGGVLGLAGKVGSKAFNIGRMFTPVGLAYTGASGLYQLAKSAHEDEMKMREEGTWDEYINQMNTIEEMGYQGAKEGGLMTLRKGFKDGPIDPSRRKFLKLMSMVLAAIPAGKYLKFTKPVKKLLDPAPRFAKAQDMPEWFPKLVERLWHEGKDETKALSTIERQVVKTGKLEGGDDVVMYHDLTTGQTRIEVSAPKGLHQTQTGAYNQSYQMEYKPGEEITSGKHKGKKTKPEFEMEEVEGRMDAAGEDIDWDVRATDTKNTMSDLTELEAYAKGTTAKKLHQVKGTKPIDVFPDYGTGPDYDDIP